MSTTTLPSASHSPQKAADLEAGLSSVLLKCLELLSSMKLTCVMFLMGMFVVFVGSLAQARRDVWLIVDQYFRTAVAWIDVQDLFPPSLFPSLVDWDFNQLGALRYLPFPGGWTIGWILLANLVAAHALRFRVRVRGGRLIAGVTVLILGALLTGLVVWTGNQQTGVEYGQGVLSPIRVWYLMLGVLAVGAIVPLANGIWGRSPSKMERTLLIGTGATLGAVLVYFLIGGEAARLNLSSMRILWQLLKGTACAVVLLIGSNLLFEKRGGIAVIHLGVALLMISELQVGMTAKENMLQMKEGETVTYMRDSRMRELAIVHRDGDQQHVVVIPEARLARAGAASDEQDRILRSEDLPFAIRVDSFHRNSQLRPLLPGEAGTSAGLGRFALSEELAPVTGMDDRQDISSVRFAILDQQNKEVASLLCSQDVNEFRNVPIAEQTLVNDSNYEFYLRFERTYNDFHVRLLDVSRTNYVGTATPKDYRSTIEITDDSTGEKDQFTLWMNNPLRYRGQTFYQTNYIPLPDGSEASAISVVRNTGWMLPYIACMIVAVGMFAQFGSTLFRFLHRLDRSGSPAADSPPDSGESSLPEALRRPAATAASVSESRDESETKSKWGTLVPLAIVLLFAAWLGSKARPPKPVPGAMNLYAFAQLPVAWRGRAQPIDSVARGELLMASHKSTFQGELSETELNEPKRREKLIARIQKYWPSVTEDSLKDFSGEYSQWIEHVMKLTSSGREAVELRLRDVMVARMPAVRWLLDMAARPDLAERHRVIRIDNDQLLSLLDLEKRTGLTFSMEEILVNFPDMHQTFQEAQQLKRAGQDARMSQVQRQVLSLFGTMSRIRGLQAAFHMPTGDGDLWATLQSAQAAISEEGNDAVRSVPTGSEDAQKSWESLPVAGHLRNASQALTRAGLKNREDTVDYLTKSLPKEMLTNTIEGTLQILKTPMTEGATAPTDEAVRLRAQDASVSLAAKDPFLGGVLKLIGQAKAGATAAEVLEQASEEDLQVVAAARIRPELVTDVLDDLEERAGGMLYGSDSATAIARGTDSLLAIMAGWQSADAELFNSTVQDYRSYLASGNLPHLNQDTVKLESFFNTLEPFMIAIYMYVTVLILGFFSWIVWPSTLRRSALWLMGLAFVLHSAALVMRMVISGRPPVTNLYSSAIFIGWAVVLGAFVIEAMMKHSIGNLLGAAVGAGTLMIAHYLALDEGDTMGVMQAVLDTTFWLATHVVCITLGYATTFLAGALGLAYCVISLFGSENARKNLVQLGKLVYGTLCFAVFFSLVGTVLGGLWADDSWGRFWGWDPKENGAMMIVMWNAVILHARWDRMVRDFGTAVLAMVGNIVTAWSWFGVNELSAGLHAYGFTEGRAFALLVFAVVQLFIIVAALLLRPANSQNMTPDAA
ncbi:MAG: cytochrome c biogenesis protein CcsA [Planctomycetaceae bacterium]